MCLETRWKLRKASFFPPYLSFLVVVMMVEEIVIFHQGSEEKECFYSLMVKELGDSNSLLSYF